MGLLYASSSDIMHINHRHMMTQWQNIYYTHTSHSISQMQNKKRNKREMLSALYIFVSVHLVLKARLCFTICVNLCPPIVRTCWIMFRMSGTDHSNGFNIVGNIVANIFKTFSCTTSWEVGNENHAGYIYACVCTTNVE